MPVERRGQVTDVGSEPTGNRRSRVVRPKAAAFVGGTSRVSRETHARICERLGVKLPGPTRHCAGSLKFPLAVELKPTCQAIASGRYPDTAKTASRCLGKTAEHKESDSADASLQRVATIFPN